MTLGAEEGDGAHWVLIAESLRWGREREESRMISRKGLKHLGGWWHYFNNKRHSYWRNLMSSVLGLSTVWGWHSGERFGVH